MQDKHLFEYGVIRIVPRVEREEFLNAGIILYCPRQRFLKAAVHLDEMRLKVFCGTIDPAVVEANLKAFGHICAGEKHSGPIGQLDMASRFRWLTATRSTVIQTSRVHPGYCTDAGVALTRLVEQLVL